MRKTTSYQKYFKTFVSYVHEGNMEYHTFKFIGYKTFVKLLNLVSYWMPRGSTSSKALKF